MVSGRFPQSKMRPLLTGPKPNWWGRAVLAAIALVLVWALTCRLLGHDPLGIVQIPHGAVD